MRIRPANAINFLALARRKILLWIETPPAFKKSLPAQNLVNSGNATAKIVGGIKERCVRICQLLRQRKQFGKIRAGRSFYAIKVTHRCPGPHCPLAQQAAGKPNPLAPEIKLAQQIKENMVIIAGVQGDLVGATRVRYRPHHIEGLIAVERRNLYGDNVLDFCQLAPKLVRQDASANTALQIKPDHRNNRGNRAGMIEQRSKGLVM